MLYAVACSCICASRLKDHKRAPCGAPPTFRRLPQTGQVSGFRTKCLTDLPDEVPMDHPACSISLSVNIAFPLCRPILFQLSSETPLCTRRLVVGSVTAWGTRAPCG